MRLLKKWIGCAFLVACAAQASADSHLAHDWAEDAKLYFTAPIRWDGRDWLHAGEAVAVVWFSQGYDDDVRAHFVDGASTSLSGKDPHSVRDAAPAAAIVAGTWAAAFLAQNHDGYAEGRDMLEAAGLSAVTTSLIKYAARRRRPNETDNSDDWRSSGDSFPSLHTSAAFAIGTILAESGNDNHRWLRRFLGYGVASATAYARLHDNVHWLSDTVAGAVVGVATARFVLRRDAAHDQSSGFSVVPTDGGLMLTYNATY